MIGRLNHVAVAVRDLGKAAAAYRKLLGAEVSDAVPLPDHGVTTVFVTLPNTKVELLEPLGPASPKLPSAYVNTVGFAAGSGRVSFEAIVSTMP